MTEYEQGQRSIQEWLAHTRSEDIPWKIQVCLNNYPDNPVFQPYYDAMLEALRERQEKVHAASPPAQQGDDQHAAS